ncbi:MAG: hypothetical protein KIT87_20930 [Anaerolineae bacterium]|nr:hypothetical protein [Anaerolineae bacterium]
MPLLEVLHAADKPLPAERKRAFMADMLTIFREVLGTPPGRLRVVIHHLPPDDTTDELMDRGAKSG